MEPVCIKCTHLSENLQYLHAEPTQPQETLRAGVHPSCSSSQSIIIKLTETMILLKTIFFKHESNSNLQEKLKMQFTDHDKPYRAVFTQSWNITIHCSIWVALWFIMVMLLVWNYIHLDTQLSVTDRQRGREGICIFPFTHFLLCCFFFLSCLLHP